jgi:hypothetical protein
MVMKLMIRKYSSISSYFTQRLLTHAKFDDVEQRYNTTKWFALGNLGEGMK